MVTEAKRSRKEFLGKEAKSPLKKHRDGKLKLLGVWALVNKKDQYKDYIVNY